MLPEPNPNSGNASALPDDEGASSSKAQIPVSSGQVSAIPTQPQQPLPPVQQQVPPNGAVTTSSPLIADDVDVIEKEWVDKAKKIVNATKSDPHQLDKEVSKLQADYLMKRYNKKLKVSD